MTREKNNAILLVIFPRASRARALSDVCFLSIPSPFSGKCERQSDGHLARQRSHYATRGKPFSWQEALYHSSAAARRPAGQTAGQIANEAEVLRVFELRF